MKNFYNTNFDLENYKTIWNCGVISAFCFQSDFVLICVSPSYRQVVDGQPLASGFDSPQNENAVNTQYIYRRIHAEYISCGSKNYRFIPVLVSGALVVRVLELF